MKYRQDQGAFLREPEAVSSRSGRTADGKAGLLPFTSEFTSLWCQPRFSELSKEAISSKILLWPRQLSQLSACLACREPWVLFSKKEKKKWRLLPGMWFVSVCEQI